MCVSYSGCTSTAKKKQQQATATATCLQHCHCCCCFLSFIMADCLHSCKHGQNSAASTSTAPGFPVTSFATSLLRNPIHARLGLLLIIGFSVLRPPLLLVPLVARYSCSHSHYGHGHASTATAKRQQQDLKVVKVPQPMRCATTCNFTTSQARRQHTAAMIVKAATYLETLRHEQFLALGRKLGWHHFGRAEPRSFDRVALGGHHLSNPEHWRPRNPDSRSLI